MCVGRTANYPTAIRDRRFVSWQCYQQAVSGWRLAFMNRPGERVALYFDDSLDFAAALMGAWHAGKCVYLPNDNRPATCEALQGEVDDFAGDFPLPINTITPTTATATDYLPLTPHTTQLIIYTSGSTASPVPIVKCLRQLMAELATLEQLWGEQLAAAQILSTVSHQHIYGLLFRLLWPLCAGRIFDARRLEYPEGVIARLADQPKAALIASPALLKRLPDNLPWPSVNDRLCAVFSSGGPLSREAAQHVCQLTGQQAIEVYGSSETGGIAWRRQNTQHETPWQVMPGVAVTLNEAGLLQVNSPHLPDDRRFSSADRAELTATGGFRLLGRTDHIIKIEEKRVSLSTMEHRLADVAEVAEARIVPIEGERLVLGAVVVLSPAGQQRLDTLGKPAFNQLLRQHLSHHVEAVALPRRWRYVAHLPQNPQGKTTQADLRQLFSS